MSFLVTWFKDIMVYLGLWKKTKRLALLGLDNSGKTTLSYIVRDISREAVYPRPASHYPAKEEFTFEGTSFELLDLGGRRPVYRTWKDYFPCIDGVVFIIDASDRERFSEARDELERILSDEHLVDSPVLILGNKIDRPGAVSKEELKTALGLHNQATGKEDLKRQPLEVFMCSVLKRQGYGEGFHWLAQYLQT